MLGPRTPDLLPSDFYFSYQCPKFTIKHKFAFVQSGLIVKKSVDVLYDFVVYPN